METGADYEGPMTDAEVRRDPDFEVVATTLHAHFDEMSEGLEPLDHRLRAEKMACDVIRLLRTS